MPKRMKEQLHLFAVFIILVLFWSLLLIATALLDAGTEYPRLCKVSICTSGIVIVFGFFDFIIGVLDLDRNSDGIEDLIFKKGFIKNAKKNER